MTRISLLCVYLIACDSGTSRRDEARDDRTTPCTEAITHMLTLTPKSEHFDAALMAKWRATQIDCCRSDKWSAAAIDCVRNMKTEADEEPCTKLLTREQLTALQFSMNKLIHELNDRERTNPTAKASDK